MVKARAVAANPTSTSTEGAARAHRSFARAAAVTFAAVAAYTIGAKLPGGEFSRDWAHTALHLATGLIAAYAGWRARDGRAARAFTVALVVAYGALGVVGWFVDGLAMGTAPRVPLGAADNVFHLLLSLAGAGAIVSARRGSLRTPL